MIGLHQSPVWAASVVKGIRLSKTNPVENTANQTFDSYITLTNTTKNKSIHGPLALIIKSINRKNVTVASSDGSINHKPYLYIPLPTGLLAPQQTLGSLVIRFKNPGKKSFKFVVQLITQLPDIHTIPPNHPAVAHAGEDQTVTVGTTAQLNGSASSDPDGDALAYQWSILKKPENSSTQLTAADQPLAGLPIDQPGQYQLKLIVHDGQTAGFPDSVLLDTNGSAPIADAGLPITAAHRATVTLDASASRGNDARTLTHAWSLPRKPGGSKAKITPFNAESPTLTLDKKGRYIARLIVSDGQQTSDPATVAISTGQSAPVANAGSDIGPAPPQQPIQLNGALSSDSDQDPLSYRWSLLYKPADSASQLSDTDKQQSQITPDTAGDYIAQLMVHDGHYYSAPDTVWIKVRDGAINPGNQAPKITSTAVTIAYAEKPYSYAVAAVDADNGDVLSYTLTAPPTGMGIHAQTGAISWTPSVNQIGTHHVTVNVTDGNGGHDAQSFQVTVEDSLTADQTRVPNLVGAMRNTVQTTLIQANIVLGGETFQYSEGVAEGQIISQSLTATSIVDKGTTIDLIISLGPNNNLPPNPVVVAPKQDQTVATTTQTAGQFLYTGDNPIQTGVAAGTIETKRAAVIRGKVLDKDNKPLPGVTVTIKDHPEFGQTLSRADGQFDMAVNGGGYLTVNFQKLDYLSAQRISKLAWQDWSVIEDVVLIQVDSKVNSINLNGIDSEFAVAEGSTVTDASGTRTATLAIPDGTKAYVYDADGSVKQTDTLSLRLTEYTVGTNGLASMPGPLPPTSAYTYAVELKADEAALKKDGKDVLFNKPVPFYVDNFLNMPVGIAVPSAYYDAGKSAWIPSADGRVIKIISVNNGLANIDSNGDNTVDTPSQLAALGITDAELATLAGYPANKTIWRVPLLHLSTYDLNYGVSAEAGSTPPSNPEAKSPDSKPDCQRQQAGSIIGCEGQTLSEQIAITGTPLFIRYDSDRMPGRKAGYSLDIPLSGETVPEVLKRIELEISVAGRTFKQTYPAQAKQRHHFEWDGLDAYGRLLQGQQQATIKIDYVYDGYYNLPPAMASSFGAASGQRIPGNIPARQEVKLSQQQTANIGIATNSHAGLGGWSLNAHHRYDPSSQILYLGDGAVRDTENSGIKTAIISTVAGTGMSGYLGDDDPALLARLDNPIDADAAIDGNLYITDFGNSCIRRVNQNGIISRIAGICGSAGFSGDGDQANLAKISRPLGLTVDSNGTIYFIDAGNKRIRKISADGIITTIAGIGVGGFSGDQGPAINARLNPNSSSSNICGDISVAADSTLFFADCGNHRVRKISPDGIISTVAGNGNANFSGDGGPALNAALNKPIGVALAEDGSFYITDSNNNRIRKVAVDGVISTIAGNGSAGFSGDGSKATVAKINHPIVAAIGKNQTIYFTEGENHRIRQIDATGIISTVAGTGSNGYSGDGGLATSAKLNIPNGMSIDPLGNLVFADYLNHRVRRITPALPGIGITDIAIPSQDGSQLYRFDASGRHLETKDTLTGKTLLTFAYDASGLLSKITDLDNHVISIERDSVGKPTAIVSAFGQRTSLSLDNNGYLNAVTNPMDERYKASYTADGLLTTLENPRQYASTMSYDVSGKLVSDTHAEDGSQRLARTDLDNGYVVMHTSAEGLQTVYSVQNITGEEIRQTSWPDGTSAITRRKADGTVIATAADGSVTTSVSSPDPRFGMLAPLVTSQKLTTGNLTATATGQRSVVLNNPADPLSVKSLTDSLTVNGRTATSSYDALSQTVTATSPAERVTKAVLNAKGRVSQLQVAGLLASHISYDAHGRLESVYQGTDAEQRKINYTYNPQGYLASVLDPLGREVQFQYDQAGRVTTQTLPDGRQVLYSYDANGNLASLTPPGQPAHLFNYTGIDQTAKYLPPDVNAGSNDTVYTYDKDKALLSVARPDGQSIELNYDNAGRLSSLLLEPADQTLAGYAYDVNTGKLTGITTPDAELGFSYNGALLTQTAWTGTIAGTVDYAYDNDFRITSITLNGANTVSYSYDADSLLTGAGDLSLTRSSQNGLLTGTKLGSMSDSYSYNSFGELSGYEAKYNTFLHLKIAYNRDKLGRITQKQETRGDVLNTFDYRYDDAGRLVEVKKNNVVQSSYSYDDNGNRLSLTKGGVTENGSYDAQDRLLTYNGASYSYTANGELLSKTVGAAVSQYDYDVLGNLKKVVLPGGGRIDYLTDGQNRRIGKKINGNLTQTFLWQGQLQPIAELDGSGNVVSRFVYATSVNVPDYMIKGGVTYRLVKDHLGSPRIVVDVATNTVAQEMEFDEFGRVIKDTNPGFQPFGFAGGLYDKDTGLVRFGARDYDALSGRWTNKDPVRFNSHESSFYKYSSNDPINLVDYFGLKNEPRGDFASDLVELASWAWGAARIGANAYQNAANFYLTEFGYVHSSLAFHRLAVSLSWGGVFFVIEGGYPLILGDYGPWYEFGVPAAYEDLQNSYESISDLLEYHLDNFFDWDGLCALGGTGYAPRPKRFKPV
ncbi:PKD domain-containing protein [Methylomonas sp. HYX-M1]|uniref:NHL domain-containing protein n=1 Tax=Methylomonas sp. HYX-M1 TaxID=3139307 RepID=UPI00345C32AB